MKNKLKGFFGSFRMTRKAFAYPYMAFLLLFVVTPLVIIFIKAFLTDDGDQITFQNFIAFFGDKSGLIVLGNSVLIGFITTVLCLVIGYPVAYLLVKLKAGKLLVLLFIMPMWVNFLLRTLATRSLFEMLGIPLGTGAVIFGMVYNYLPFMILPLHTTLSSVDKSFREAAADLGCPPVKVFLHTTLPLSMPGIISGITMVFVPTISTFAISELLSYSKVHLFGDYINSAFSNGLYGVGSVMSIIMLILVLISNFFLNKFNKNQQGVRNLW